MSLRFNNYFLLILTVVCIFIIIPSTFAAELDENQTINSFEVDDSTQDSILTVEDGVIYVSPTSTGGDGSQDNPYNLSKAIETYDSSVNSKIVMKNGEYVFTEQLTLNKDITIDGESYNGVILNGNNEVSILKASKGNIVLSNLKFINGYSTYSYFDNHAGGLQITYVSHILIDNCIFENNANGALSASGSKSVVDVQNSVFDSNYVEYDWSARGAAINAAADSLVLNVVNSTFKNNYLLAGTTQGGAIYGGNNFESFVFDNCKFINNTAEDGGSAIYSYCGGNITLSNVQFINQTPSVVYDVQRNNRELCLFIRNVTFDNESDINIDVSEKINIINLDNNTRLTANSIKMDVGDDKNFTVTLTDANGNPIEGKEIIVNLTNYYNQVTTLRESTDSNGQVSFSMKSQTPGRYNVLSYFEGGDDFDRVEASNTIWIASEEFINLYLIPDSIKIKEGDSYIIVGYITDEYNEPSSILSHSSVVVEWNNPNKHSLTNAAIVEGDSFTFDISECSLKTNDVPYNVTFIVDSSAYAGYVSEVSANLTVDLSVELPDVEDIDVIYVSQEYGDDVTGNGSQDNPLASVQLALILNKALGGGKTIIVDEGTYGISNFNILSDVTIIGKKDKTVFRQVSGRDGIFKIFEPITVNLVNLTLIDGYTTPMPYSLITAYGENVVVNIEGCEFRNNTCLNGATIAISHGASVYVNNSKFIDNKCILIQSTGGAIYVLDGYLKVTNSEFINNTACDGGAIWIGYPGTADIINSTFERNYAYNTSLAIGGGGAIYAKGVTTIQNSSFIENFADLYGGAVYLAGGETTISKSYFEGNGVGNAQDANAKGSAIQSEPWSAFEFTLEYSVLLSDDYYNYLALFGSSDEAEVNLNYNYWRSNTWHYKNTNLDVSDYVIIQGRADTTPVYKGGNTSVDIEFKNYNVASREITSLKGYVHDYTVDVSSQLNEIDSSNVTIVNNIARAAYYPNNTGYETITAKDIEFGFNVFESSKSDANANLSIIAGNPSKIIVEVPEDLANNVSIIVNDVEYSRSAGNGTIVLSVDTLPGVYNVVVNYEEDSKYKGFSQSTSFSIDKYKSSLTVEVNNIYVDQAAYVEIKVTPGATGDLLILLNGRYQYETSIEDNGEAFKYIYELPAGTYTVDVTYNGDKYYEGCSGNTSFNVSEREPEPVGPVDGYAFIYIETGSETTLTIRLPENLTENVTITVNDDVYSRASDDGVIVLTIPTETGSYFVNVDYAGDENYNPFSASKTFKIYDFCWFIGETGFRTLREAVDAAVDGDVIKGNISVYETDETVDVGHRSMPSEPWEIVKDITITSMDDNNPVTIKGMSHRLFYVDKDSHLTLSNLILTGSNVGQLDGGAVENTYDSYVSVINCTFTNFAADRGGALFLWGKADVKDSIFIDNYATLGGAIFVLSPVTNDNNVILDNITLINNSAMSYGGAIYISGSSYNRTIINNSDFVNNLGHGKGGAIFVTQGDIVIDNTVFDSNRAIDYDFENDVDLAGGAVYLSGYVNANISNTEFKNNYAQDFAGALVCDNSKLGMMDLTTGEETVVVYYVNMDNCTFSNNTAGISAGAIYMGLNAVSTVNIADSKLDSNKAPDAAAISNNYGELFITNTEFTNNVASGESLITSYGTQTDDVFNAITMIVDSKFENNDVSVDINQLNSYTMLTIDNSTFADESIILINKGEAILNNVVQNKDSLGYAVINNNSISLSENTFINPINNNGKVLSETYIVVLDNETKSAAVGSVYNLKAFVCDDNGNIIEKGNLVFVIGSDEIAAIYADHEFSADYNVSIGSQIVSAKYDDSGLMNLKVKTGELISKNLTDVDIDINDIEVGDNATITVNVYPQATGNVTVKINNKTYDVSIKDGEAKFVIPDLSAGEYSVEVVYSGDDNFAPATVNENLSVNKVADYNFDVVVSDITTDSAKVAISLPEDVTVDVTVSVDGVNQTVAVKDGKASVDLTNLSIGAHDVEVTFEGNEKYLNASKQASFSINKLDSFVKAVVSDIVVGDEAVVIISVPDDATGDVIISIGGKEYVATVSNGKANYALSGLDIGTYSVEVTYIGDAKYLDSVNATEFNVLKPALKETVIRFTGIDGNVLSGVLEDVERNVIANANLTIVGSPSKSVVTGNDGSFSFACDYGVVIIDYAGDDNYLATNASFKFGNSAPAMQSTVIVGNNFTQYALDYDAGERGQNFTVQLKDANGNILANKTVLIGYNGKTLTRITNATGHASVQINLRDANRLTFAVAFLGDDEYNATMSVYLITINKKPVTITAAAKTYKATAKTKKYTVTLKTIKGSSADGKTYFGAGKKVTMKINGKTYTAKTNAKGQATFSLKLTKKGKFTATIKYAGDTTYKAASKSVKITIK